MSFHENDFDHIKTKKPNISSFGLLSTNCVGIDFMKSKESALLRVITKYTITPIRNILRI